MADTSSERCVLLNQLADEFAARYRRGERPSIQEYCDQHPELADDIRGFFPTVVEMERVKDDARVEITSAPSVPPIEQLGDFQIMREIGHGGMGVVYEAEQVSLGRRVALKLLTQRMLRDANQRRRFEREAKSAARLHHTNIVPVFGSGEHDGTPYYVMQFIQGTGLDIVVEEVARLEGGGATAASSLSGREVPAAAVARSLVTGGFEAPTDEPEDAGGVTGTFVLPAGEEPGAPKTPATSTVRFPSDPSGVTSSVTLPGHSGVGSGRKARKLTYWQGVARIGVQVADALEYAHRQGIIHRDVKPSNLLLDLAGTVWVTDFGLAKADGAENLTHTGDILGTLRYMPPEAFDGKADARSDLYSLGLTLYEMLALRPAFDERDRNKLIKQVTTAEPTRLRKIRRGVPRDLETIVHKAIDRDPAQRYQRAEELATDLQRFLDDEPIKARRQTAAESAWRWARRHKAMAALMVMIGLVLVTVTVGSVVLAAHFREQETVQRKLVDDKTELAERNRKLADDNEAARATTERARRQAETTLVDMQASRGLLAAERGDSALAVLWFAKAADQAASDPQRQADNRLRARNWARDVVLPASAFPVGSSPTKMTFRPGDDLLLIHMGMRFYVWDWRQEKALLWANGTLPISSVCWSPDGAHLAVGLPTGRVQIRSIPDGAIIRTLFHTGPITALAYSPDGSFLATADDVVRLWDTRDPTFLKPLKAGPPGAVDPALKAAWGHPQPVDAMAFNSAGNRLATACRDKKARVFSVTDRKKAGALFPPVTHTPLVPSPPAFIDNDRGLLTVTGERELTWWDAESGKITRPDAVRPRPFPVEQVVASPQGDWLGLDGDDNGEVWNTLDGGKKSLALDHLNSVKDFAFSADGKLLLTVSRDHTARLLSLPDGRPVGYPLAHMAEVTRCAISGDSRYLATSRLDGQIRIWKRPVNGLIQWESRGWAPRPRVSFDGHLLAPGRWHEAPYAHGGLGRVVVLDALTGKPAGPALAVPHVPFDSCVCADNQTVAVLSLENLTGWLTFWDVPTGRALFEPKNLPSRPLSVAARPNNAHVAVLCQSGELLVFNSQNGERVHTLRHEGWRSDGNTHGRVEYTADGATLVSLTGDITALHVWDSDTGKLRYAPIRPVMQGGGCRSFAISTDGKMLATAINGKNAAQVWDLTTGRALSEPLPHPGDLFGLFHVCFSPDGRYLLTACKDGQARLWDWKAGTLACPPLLHRDEVYGGSFTSDGRYAITASRGKPGAVQVWELTTGKPVAPPVRFPTSVNTLALSPDGTRVFAVAGNSVARIDLAELLAPPATPTEDFTLLGELTSAQRIELGDVSGLNVDQWLGRWGQFHQKYPAFDRPSLAEAVARGTTHRQRARALLEAGRYAEALAAWRQALVEIDRAVGSDEQRRPLRAEILKEARTRHEHFLATQPDNAVVAGSLADLLLESREPVEWAPLRPTIATSAGGATLTVQPDGSMLASGKNPDTDVYTLLAEFPGATALTALRIDALTDPSLPNHGPGRANDGNFCLTDLRLTVGNNSPPVAWTWAIADYSQMDGGTYQVSTAIDHDPRTGWAIRPRLGEPHWAIFLPHQPITGSDPLRLRVQLAFELGAFKGLGLGRFRVSATTRPNVARDENLIALAEGKDGRTRLATAYLVRGEWNLALAAIQKAASAPGSTAHDHLLLAFIHEHLGQPAAADKALDEALKRMTAWPSDRLLLDLAINVIAPRIAREPENPLLLLARFRCRAHLGHPTEALADLDRALKLDRALALRPSEDGPALFALGDAAAARGEWHLVGTAYSRMLDLNPTDHWVWFRAAIVHAYLGNEKEYRRACEGMLKKFGGTSDPMIAERVAKACFLLPGVIADRTKPGELADLASKTPTGAPWLAWWQQTKSLAEYREGRFAAAAEWIEKSLASTPAPECRSSAGYLLAMAQYRQGEFGKARATAAHAVAQTPELDGPQRGAATWHDWLVVHTLRREAEAILAPAVAPPPREVK